MQIKKENIHRPVLDISKDLRLHFEHKQETQRSIESNTHVNQGQISKILDGKIKYVSKNVLKLCKYAKISPYISSKYDIEKDKKLMEELKRAIAGSQGRAQIIIGVAKVVARAMSN